jgi:hypothetical protein
MTARKTRAHNVVQKIAPLAIKAGLRGTDQHGCTLNDDHRTLEFHLDAAGRQHFNFKQQIWLEASVPMAFTPCCYTRALETLAVNLLTLATEERDYRAARGATSRWAVTLARRFCEECLLQAPAEAWQLRVSVLRSWLSAHLASKKRNPCAW